MWNWIAHTKCLLRINLCYPIIHLNYIEKQKMWSVWQQSCPRLKNSRSSRELKKKKKIEMKIREIIYGWIAETPGSRSEFGNRARSFCFFFFFIPHPSPHWQLRERCHPLPTPSDNLRAKKSNADRASAQQRAIVYCIIHSILCTDL